MFKLKALIFVCAGLVPLSSPAFAGGDEFQRLYELYSSTSTPENYKQMLKHSLDRMSHLKNLRDKVLRAKQADVVFGIVRAYAVPNPAVGVKHPLIRVETSGPADKIEIRVYAPGGALKEEAVVLKPVRDLGDVHIYEYRFASEDTPYGSCTFTVRAFGKNFSDSEVSGPMVFVNAGNFNYGGGRGK